MSKKTSRAIITVLSLSVVSCVHCPTPPQQEKPVAESCQSKSGITYDNGTWAYLEGLEKIDSSNHGENIRPILYAELERYIPRPDGIKGAISLVREGSNSYFNFHIWARCDKDKHYEWELLTVPKAGGFDFPGMIKQELALGSQLTLLGFNWDSHDLYYLRAKNRQ